MKGYFIDARKRKITDIEYDYIDRPIRNFLPGGICLGRVFDNGDVLYVDDEALLQPVDRAFLIKSRPDGQPMMSDGVMTGRDDVYTTLPPRMTKEQLLEEIEWLDLDRAMSWFIDRSAGAAVATTDGTTTDVLATWSHFVSRMRR